MAEVKYNLGNLGVVPSGAVIPFAGVTAPVGFLLCDGSAVSRTDYPYLFNVIGTTYGEGDGSATFNLPNLQDKFVQGAGTNAVGTEMSAGLPNIEGQFGLVRSDYASTSGVFSSSGNSGIGIGGSGGTTGSVKFNASRSNSIYGNSDTVQPPAVVMNYIIKY